MGAADTAEGEAVAEEAMADAAIADACRAAAEEDEALWKGGTVFLCVRGLISNHSSYYMGMG